MASQKEKGMALVRVGPHTTQAGKDRAERKRQRQGHRQGQRKSFAVEMDTWPKNSKGKGKGGKVRQVDEQTSGGGKQQTDASTSSGSIQQQSNQGTVLRLVLTSQAQQSM